MRISFNMRLSFLLFLLLHGAMGSVPGCHSDRDKDHRPRENCTGAGFSHIPAGLEYTTQVLLFPHNLFSSLSWTSFQIFTELYEIDLTANKVPEVTPSSGPILRDLSVLRLGSNRLTFLSDGSFTACPSLTELYLENNSIASLTDQTFSGLSKLEILDLTGNQISRLPDLMLHPLPAIETLYLEQNKIKVMSDNWFSPREDVPYLYLSENPWVCSCSLGYLRRYLDDYELNFYVRDGPIIKVDPESLVCDSPQEHQGKPVLSLEESDLCPTVDELESPGDFYVPINAAPNTPTTPEPTTYLPPVVPSTTDPTTSEYMTTWFPELSADYTRVVTWSWYQTFTSLLEWSYHSGSEIRKETLFVRSVAQTTDSIPKTSRSSTSAFIATTDIPSTILSTTVQTVPTDPTTEAITEWIPTLVSFPSPVIWRKFKVNSAGGGGVFCIWLFAGCLLLCIASATCILVTVMNMLIWYKKVYKPLSLTLQRRVRSREGVALLSNAVPVDKGVVAHYQSLLFVHREGGDIVEGDGRNQGQIITVNLTAGEETGDGKGADGRGVYRKTMYRLLSREEEIDGWREVVEECQVSAEDGGKKTGIRTEREPKGDAGVAVSKKRYSVILREEREEAEGGREELDWVVGGWEVKRGAEEVPRSSWGEWLAEYLPSMPWGLTAPSEEEAAAK
ncbi:PREDICTED: platelet glycoprotein Ib alpha chain-like [Cyprinodon variegatus]|uniref:platelet glycoprotein Ib alpha chain-like n=1 Tax=Cyprinodon variegatus TaxID=28743 RepID=UPI0007425199|nr:PREDICTED: platelet glycoprotein Ib alpha chain-like [Cyprinodon variegatus]